MARRKVVALGRGLGALLPAESLSELRSETPRVHEGARQIRTELITPNPYQPRQSFDGEALDDLVRSIAEHGIITPITVRAVASGRFEIIAGERRVRAARQVGLKSIPALVRLASTNEMLELALVENLQREELNPIEVAQGYRRLIDECGLQQEQVARRVCKGRSTVANSLRLLRLPKRVQVALQERTITAGHARALLRLSSADVQLKLLAEIERKQLSVRQVESKVAQLTSQVGKNRKQPKRPQQSAQLRHMEQSLRRRYGTKVKLTSDGSGKGKVELHFYSAEERERMLELLLGH